MAKERLEYTNFPYNAGITNWTKCGQIHVRSIMIATELIMADHIMSIRLVNETGNNCALRNLSCING